MALTLPSVPANHKDFLHHIDSQPDTPIGDLVLPYNDYDSAARKIFAQDPSHALVKDNHANIVPLYDATGSTDIRVRARALASETPEQKEKYILPLDKSLRRENGSSAVVSTLAEFQGNFALFTEGALNEMDWSNVVAAGSAVVTCLLPAPGKHRKSKRGLRQYYHDEFAPASDVDLFIYGLTEEQAIEKIIHIGDAVRNTILYETTTIRTKNTITIASQYPTRHMQIVLRIYRSVAEILTGFDVDSSCAAYDGQQVYASPRAIAAYITQTNQVDLTRRSPSYENRLSKYSHRGFDVFWPSLDRSKIDPSIFGRSFATTEGLARLLVLEKLPKTTDRDAYQQKRREERGHPLRRHQGRELKGNLKDDWEDEVPEWQEEDQVSSYHTFTIPYGRRYNARRIENLLYTKDLLLNAEYHQPQDRHVYLHRHPAFFGEAKHVIGDCCGFCPQPVTEEERKIAEEESKIYISGKISFVKDNPGRQEIGSFNPITETDWTEMAYIAGTEKLCQAIVSHDLEAVKAFLDQGVSNPNRRDITGRTPLQLACMSSTPEVVQCLVDHGARLIARMADGKTALHLAAARGNVEIIRILLMKSDENEEAESQYDTSAHDGSDDSEGDKDHSEDYTEDGHDVDSVCASVSYVKVEVEDHDNGNALIYDSTQEDDGEPDVYDINVVAWDSLTTPLHLAILHGHVEAVKKLVSFGADVLMPIKIINEQYKTPQAAILNLVLVLALPLDKAREMSQTLLQLGGSPAQADLSRWTPLHYIAQSDYTELLDLYREHDEPAVQRAINHLAVDGTWWDSTITFCSALVSAIQARKHVSATKLLDMGAKPFLELEDLLNAAKAQMGHALHDDGNSLLFKAKQPILCAIEDDMPLIALDLLNRGADPNTKIQGQYDPGWTALDRVRTHLTKLRKFLNGPVVKRHGYWEPKPRTFASDDESYLCEFKEGSYQMFFARNQLNDARESSKRAEEQIESAKDSPEQVGTSEKRDAIAALIHDYETLETELLAKGAKTAEELDPDAASSSSTPCHAPSQTQEKPEIEKPFKFEFKFTDATGDGYLQLFEAAWNGDITTIKALTLGMWGSSQDQPPLDIAVCDGLGFSRFSLAVLRGHLRVAKAIIQILRVQYKVKKPERSARFEIDSNGDSSDDDDLNLVSHDVGGRFTHENIGEVTTRVESSVPPTQALQRYRNVFLFLDEYSSTKHEWKFCPSEQSQKYYYGYPGEQPQRYYYGHRSIQVDTLMKYAIFKNDMSLLDFLLTACRECASMFPDKDDSDRFRENLCEEFQLAMILGHIDCLAKIIRFSAVGLPLAKLSKNSGVQAQTGPQYYQGLSIRGKKRSDWASAGRPDPKGSPEGRPPLLISAMQGNLTSTEWLLGTAPARHYLEYVNSHLENEHIKILAQSKLGLEGSVLNWLQTRKVRSEGGHTPLAIAFSLRRTSFARILIAAGANQAARDPEGNNLLHILLRPVENHTSKNSEDPSTLINLLDKELVSSMLIQRAGDGSWTPLARELHSYQLNYHSGDQKEAKKQMAYTTTLLLNLAESTNQKHLELLDGSGNTPVHEAVKKGFTHLLELMLDRRPDLLYRENATGSTPLEMAVDAWVNNTTHYPPGRISQGNNYWNHGRNYWNAMSESAVYCEPRFFIKGWDSRKKEKNVYQICQERAQQHQGEEHWSTFSRHTHWSRDRLQSHSLVRNIMCAVVTWVVNIRQKRLERLMRLLCGGIWPLRKSLALVS